MPKRSSATTAATAVMKSLSVTAMYGSTGVVVVVVVPVVVNVEGIGSHELAAPDEFGGVPGSAGTCK
jgi:hypothetical protein